ncbi:RNA polymerase sigma factor [Arcticibacter sp. MXS-1]|uniref:RNA polymerase sigma factor n=1 Tax=Arcticibacter sp. MXS-1 TaxID=3341726 RepID=UPI0035A980F1
MDIHILLEKVMEGDIDAYSLIYKESYKKLYNYGRKFCTDTALVEDCIQEVFFDLWNRKDKIKQIQSFNSYLYSSFRYTLMKKLREQKKLGSWEEAEGEEGFEFSTESVIIGREQDAEKQKSLREACKQLTPRQYEAIFLRYYERLSYEEVAAVLKISVKATYKIMARSLAALKASVKFLLL